MHSRELVQVAATLAAHAPLLIEARGPFPSPAVELHWVAAKCRQDSWDRSLKEFALEKQDPATLPAPAGTGNWIQPILEEILTAEVLTRVWACVCTLADVHRGSEETGPIAQNMLAANIEVRNRVLGLMVYGYGLRVEESVALNRLRMQNERWTDTLLSMIGTAAGRSPWAFQPKQVRQSAAVWQKQDTAGEFGPAKSLLLATLGVAYQRRSGSTSPNSEWNRRIACSIVACFPPSVFDSTGRLVSKQFWWLSNASADSQLLPPRNSNSDVQGPSSFPPGDGDHRRRFDFH